MEKKNNIKFWIIILLLIIIILILLFFTRFGKIENNLVPTGNVDVFDIDINCNCKNNDTCYNDTNNRDDISNSNTNSTSTDSGNSSSTEVYNNSKTFPTYDEIKYKDVIGTIFVDDNSGNYVYQQNLRIFTNSAFEYTNKIAPGVSNTYNFVVHNSTNVKLRYYVEMYEESEYSINLKYRLRRNNSYVIGNNNTWVSASELKTEFSKINASASDNYSLDWQWMYDDGKDNDDSVAGENMTSAYKLNIRFYFEQVEE